MEIEGGAVPNQARKTDRRATVITIQEVGILQA